MPFRRPLPLRELEATFPMFGRSFRIPLATIRVRVEAGARLEMEQSVFSDAVDYCEVLLDGKSIAYIPGY